MVLDDTRINIFSDFVLLTLSSKNLSVICFFFIFSDKKHSVEELVAMMLNNTRHTAENFAGMIKLFLSCFNGMQSFEFLYNFRLEILFFKSANTSIKLHSF